MRLRQSHFGEWRWSCCAFFNLALILKKKKKKIAIIVQGNEERPRLCDFKLSYLRFHWIILLSFSFLFFSTATEFWTKPSFFVKHLGLAGRGIFWFQFCSTSFKYASQKRQSQKKVLDAQPKPIPDQASDLTRYWKRTSLFPATQPAQWSRLAKPNWCIGLPHVRLINGVWYVHFGNELV